MKNLKLFSAIIMASLFACTTPVTFDEPQPADKDNLSELPLRLQGQYVSLEDSSTLSIDNKFIQRIYDFDYKIHPNQLTESFQLIGDTLIDQTTGDKTICTRQGDSLMNHVHYVDTLFQMDFDNVARKFKGYYFLNTRHDKSGWEVKKVQFSKGQLVISTISNQLDLDNLNEINELPSDTVSPQKYSVTKKQFKDFVKNGGFSDSETFVRL